MSPVETAGLVLTSLTIVGILLGSLGWWINQKIKEATYQIQPNTNGGKSLSDLHSKVDSLADDVRMLKRSVVNLEDEMEDLRE
jgi:hypothetical protein